MKDNQNWLCLVCGPTGTGKSYSAMSIANMITCIKPENIVFDPKQFMERINSGELKKGDIIIFDEAGVGMSSRDWNTVSNKLFGAVLQTFRNMNIGCIFTTPDLGFIDIQARKLIHNYLETRRIDRHEKIAHLSPYIIQHNSKQNKTYIKNPRIKSGGQKVRVTDIPVPMPPPELVKQYEEKKLEYTTELNKRVLEDLQPKEEKVPLNYGELADKYKSKFGIDDVSISKIVARLGIKETKARIVRQYLCVDDNSV